MVIIKVLTGAIVAAICAVSDYNEIQRLNAFIEGNEFKYRTHTRYWKSSKLLLVIFFGLSIKNLGITKWTEVLSFYGIYYVFFESILNKL